LTNFLVDIARTTVTPESSLVPYTTLFRSRNGRCRRQARRRTAGSAHTARRRAAPQPKAASPRAAARKWRRTGDGNAPRARQVARSEEHTSELQSRENFVCRLLLEKKK